MDCKANVTRDDHYRRMWGYGALWNFKCSKRVTTSYSVIEAFDSIFVTSRILAIGEQKICGHCSVERLHTAQRLELARLRYHLRIWQVFQSRSSCGEGWGTKGRESCGDGDVSDPITACKYNHQSTLGTKATCDPLPCAINHFRETFSPIELFFPKRAFH